MTTRASVEVGGEWQTERIARSGEGDDERVFVYVETWKLEARRRVQVSGPKPSKRAPAGT